jgi:glycosyltransferase involved in cell wall biosynthesis
MRNCDVFLFSSTLEACPFTLLEAMREGSAIVSTNCPPMPEFGGTAVLYADPDDASQFANAACRIINESELRNSLKSQARKRSENFNWKDTVKNLLCALEGARCVSS